VDNIVTPGGTFSFNPDPGDGAVIDPVSGEVTNGLSGATYTINYSTNGTCVTDTDVTFTVLPADDAFFSMTPTCDGGTVDNIATPGGTFDFVTTPTDGAVIDAATGTVTNATPGASYDVSYSVNVQCANSSSFTLTVFDEPLAVAPTPLEVCDDGTPDGITDIDLSLKNGEISGGNPDYVVTYYNNSTDASAATNALAIPYTNTTPDTEVVWVRVEEVSTGCFSLTQLTLVVQQAPVAFTPDPLEFCDPDSDGFGIFDLTQAQASITGGASGLSLSYHETLTNAENNVNPIINTSSYANIVVNTQTIWVRVESATIATDCPTIVALQLVVNPTPQLLPTPVTPIAVCDELSADGFATFDLTVRQTELLNGIDPLEVSLTYYETQADADAATNAIATPNAYINTAINTQTIWVRVSYNNTGCYKLISLELIVNPLPVVLQPGELELCDDEDVTLRDEIALFTLEDANASILNGQTGISLTYYETLADAQSGTNPLVSPYSNTSNPQTIYVRAEDDLTGCVNDTVSLTLRVNPPPSPSPNVSDLVLCDEDNDGFSSFDLTQRDLEIINGEANVVVTYHETQIDADLGANPLVSPYNNVVQDSQVIFVRVESTVSGCSNSTTSRLTLIVEPIPVLPATITDYVICDTDTNGFAQFDLTTKNIEIYGTQDINDFSLSFHESLADAESGLNAIATPNSYTNTSNPQTLWVRLERNDSGCYATRSFDLLVNTPPTGIVAPIPLEVCEDLGDRQGDPGFGFTQFDLTSRNNEITNNNTNLEVTYFETQFDAENNVNVIADPTSYTNLSIGGAPVNPQTLFVRVTDPSTGCAAFTTLTISVLPNPSPTPSANIPALVLCDADATDADLLASFDLTENETLILNGETGNNVTYHTDALEADTGTNAIADPMNFINTQSLQTIYVRVTNTSTGCYELVTFDIVVDPLPEASTALNDLIGCELNTDGVMTFDLTQQDAQALGGQDPSLFTVTYHQSQADADALVNPIVSPFNNTTLNRQQIFVAITNTTTGCSIALQNFSVIVNEAAQANADLDDIRLQICDDNIEFDGNVTNDSAQFDLSSLDTEVLDGQDASNYSVSYYASQADADAGENSLPTLYENTVNPQVIIARVDNDTPGVGIITLDVSGIPVGTPLDFDSDGNADTFDSDGDGITDLIDVNGDGVDDGIDVNGDGLIDFIDLDGDGQGDLVDLDNDGVVDNNFDGSICYATTALTLEVLPLPEVNLEERYMLCLNTNGSEVINPSPPVIDTGLTTANYSFVWRETSAPNTILGTNATFSPTAAGTYEVFITNLNTGCSSSDQTIVEVSEPPLFSAEVSSASFSEVQVITVTLIEPLLGEYEYSLNDGAWQDENVFTGMGFGTHTVTVRDKNGCGLGRQELLVIDYPRFFTPNGDGFNETWNISSIRNAKIYIFDRYGKLLKQISSDGNGWDGTYLGEKMPSNDYWFTIEYQEFDQNSNTFTTKEFKANFALKR